ncbi:MAG: hypothetical protein CM15mP19_00090 [Gammaproteobacteria bacterium]|nr:MAG: hypothetical protein CM15mP19_00090 [Gammaproteobacteria bacterium]
MRLSALFFDNKLQDSCLFLDLRSELEQCQRTPKKIYKYIWVVKIKIIKSDSWLAPSYLRLRVHGKSC